MNGAGAGCKLRTRLNFFYLSFVSCIKLCMTHDAEDLYLSPETNITKNLFNYDFWKQKSILSMSVVCSWSVEIVVCLWFVLIFRKFSFHIFIVFQHFNHQKSDENIFCWDHSSHIKHHRLECWNRTIVTMLHWIQFNNFRSCRRPN